MRALGYLGLTAVLAIMVMVVTQGPAVANPARGYHVTYVADRDHYCVRPVSEGEAARLGIALYKTECHSAAAWAHMGLKVSR